jgi:hypothetical protein
LPIKRPGLERTRGLLVERCRVHRGDARTIELEHLAGDESKRVAVEDAVAGQVIDPPGIALAQLDGGLGEIDVVGRARHLVGGDAHGLAPPAMADELVDEVLRLAVGTVDHGRADRQRARHLGQHGALAFPLAPPYAESGLAASSSAYGPLAPSNTYSVE